MIQTNQLSVKGHHDATIFGEVQTREIKYLWVHKVDIYRWRKVYLKYQQFNLERIKTRNKHMKLSIVVPCYNEEKVIDETISVLLNVTKELKAKDIVD